MTPLCFHMMCKELVLSFQMHIAFHFSRRNIPISFSSSSHNVTFRSFVMASFNLTRFPLEYCPAVVTVFHRWPGCYSYSFMPHTHTQHITYTYVHVRTNQLVLSDVASCLIFSSFFSLISFSSQLFPSKLLPSQSLVWFVF